jgi:hypothetical protein
MITDQYLRTLTAFGLIWTYGLDQHCLGTPTVGLLPWHINLRSSKIDWCLRTLARSLWSISALGCQPLVFLLTSSYLLTVNMQWQFINMFTIHDNKIDMVSNKMSNNLYTIKETRIQNIIKDHHVSPMSKKYSQLFLCFRKVFTQILTAI